MSRTYDLTQLADRPFVTRAVQLAYECVRRGRRQFSYVVLAVGVLRPHNLEWERAFVKQRFAGWRRSRCGRQGVAHACGGRLPLKPLLTESS